MINYMIQRIAIYKTEIYSQIERSSWKWGPFPIGKIIDVFANGNLVTEWPSGKMSIKSKKIESNCYYWIIDPESWKGEYYEID